MIKLMLADIPVGIEERFDNIVKITDGYTTEKEPIFTVKVTDEELEEEKTISGINASSGYFESTVVYRHIAEIMPNYDAFLFHSSVIDCGEYAFVITANSGVGKTTHSRIWLSEFSGEVEILNGDKPLVRFIDGAPYVFGTPWRGKEGYGKPGKKPLKAIIFLERSKENYTKKIEPKEAVVRFMKQIYLPKRSPAMLAKTLSLANKLLLSVDLICLDAIRSLRQRTLQEPRFREALPKVKTNISKINFFALT